MTTTPPASSRPSDTQRVLADLEASIDRLGLRRTDETWVAGVCDGVAVRLGIDPVVVRVGFIVLTLFGGLGVAAYAVLWLTLPAPDGVSILRRMSEGPGPIVALAALAGTALGALILTGVYFGSSSWGFGQLVLVLGAGVVAYALMRRGHSSSGPAPVGQPPTTAQEVAPEPLLAPPPATPMLAPDLQHAAAFDDVWPSAAGPTATAIPLASTAIAPSSWAAPAPTAARSGPPVSEAGAFPETGHPSYTEQATIPRPTTPRRPTRLRRRRLSPYVALSLTGLALAIITTGALLTDAEGWAGHGVTIGFAAALGVVALILVVAGATGRRGGLSTLLALLLALGTGASAVAADPMWSGGVGDRYWSLAAPQPSDGFRLGVGGATLDLGDLARTSTDKAPLHVPVRIGVGEVRILLPADATVRVIANISAGNVYRADSVDQATPLHYDQTFGSGTPDVTVDIRMHVGDVRIEGGAS